MNELGQWLREAREAKGLSLAEAEATTRIRQKFLAALEADEWDTLPGDVAAIGFLRKYAIYLGLDPQVAVERFRARGAKRPNLPEIPEPPPERVVDYRPIGLDLETAPPRQIPWKLIAALSAVLILLIGVGSVLFFQPTWLNNLSALLPAVPFLSTPTPTSAPETLATPTRIVIRVTATPTATALVTATPTTAPTAQAALAATPDAASVTPETPQSLAAPIVERIVLQLDTTQRSWVSVNVDGQTALETILEAGETRTWEGRQFIAVRTGNAAGVLITVNDELQGLLGGPGEVVELRWALTDGEIVRSTPEPAPTATATPEATPPTP
jgi:cytoskeletal protein RodZ